ncbi:MAG TPA: TonB-dependent receptor [Vicinamibacterales bacterium]|nr:TonB-dependent receptor [Vicinamibacterales bacterium]
MRRLTLVGALAGVLVATSVPGYAQTSPVRQASVQTARMMLGSIHGVVVDDRGGPLPGVMVSALGLRMAMAVTDVHGYFLIPELPPGEYVVSAHLAGFSAAPRALIRVEGHSTGTPAIQLRRLNAGADAPLAARPILAAGLELPSDPAAVDSASAGDHSHGETAWRLRHLPRSILKDSGAVVATADAGEDGPPNTTADALDANAGLATPLFDFPLSGEVNLLTTSAIPAGQLFSSDLLPRGVAYLSIGAPLGDGDWTVRAAMTQANLASWVVAGSYASKPASGSHEYHVGVSYSTQQYQGGNPGALAGVGSASRSVGELYANDRWTLTKRVLLDYGGEYGRYDYLRQHWLASPYAGITVTPVSGTRISATVASRMLAPGAEEFLAPSVVGPWLPPERTFAPLAGQDLQVERGRFLDLGVEHDVGMYVIGVRRFYQRVDDQLLTIFGLPVADGEGAVGQYSVASAGDVDASGWGVRLSTTPKRHVRGSVDYSITRAQWLSQGDLSTVALLMPALRSSSNEIHDLTASVDAEIPESATRVFVLYRVDSGFARQTGDLRSGLDGRFDVQVNQALPFMPFSSTTKWEVLVGVRNLFRDPEHYGSIYDELLVVRPPKRVVGGVLVRF